MSKIGHQLLRMEMSRSRDFVDYFYLQEESLGYYI